MRKFSKFLLVLIACAGCNYEQRLDTLEQDVQRMQEESEQLKERLETIADLPQALKADVAATRSYLQKVEKDVGRMRERWALLLDTHSRRINEMRLAYLEVLLEMQQEQARVAEAIQRSIEALARHVPGPADAGDETIEVSQ